ncbi:MAG TPA: THUMP domain-containing protein [Burkholderiaceae bacterium]|nr:THUMP domain-containing protein [Burkholderiaceae bacterium]
MPDTSLPLFLPCAGGTETLLADEVRRLLGTGAEVREARGGVFMPADLRAAMRLNLESRLAQRVLWPLAHAPYASEHDLYDLARSVRWVDWITPRQTLRVDTSATRSPLQSLNFASLRIKDAVCDSLREAVGDRPSVDTRHPDLAIVMHLSADHASLYADTSGEALFKRGWRDAAAGKGEAPLKETLAAAMLAAAGWQGRAEDGPLLDPCCGAGTIAIEAAQLACGMAPGARRKFAFERLAPFQPLMRDWQDLKREALAREHAPAVPVFAGDVAFRMTDFATRNAQRAGVPRAIEFKTVDALQRVPPAERGTLLVNPPYGERIEAKGQGRTRSVREDAEAGEGGEFFAQLAAQWKRHYAGWTAWVLSPDMKLPGRMRLKESRRVPMWNGPLECRLFCFEMVSGSARKDSPAPT